MGAKGGRSLEQTPTWAVAGVCFVLVAVSVVIEHIIHLLGKWLSRRNKKDLYEAVEKIKSELLLLGFISLLLTVGQGPISEICVSKGTGDSWHPCTKKQENHEHRRRRLLEYGETERRGLAGGGGDRCADKGMVPVISSDGIHQLHIFIFVLAVFHVLCCLITLALARLKMRKWKGWEMESRTAEYQYAHDPERFRFARDTSFGRRHMSSWTQSPTLLCLVCFFRQFVRSVPKVDYLTLRHGFIIAHLAPHNETIFDFQKYIKRTLEEDFKVVVGISPPIWFSAVLFLLFNTNGWKSYLWLPFVPLIMMLLVSTKLQLIITKMGLSIQDRGVVVKGAPLVQPGDDLFWFNRPRLLLYLIQFVFFQNSFQLAYFAWTWYEFGNQSCIHKKKVDVVIRISMGVAVQILCSYVTIPLYALVTQMGSNMKPTIFNERVAKAIQSWHQTARKQIKKNRHLGSVTPMSSVPTTPHHDHGLCYKTEAHTAPSLPRASSYGSEPTPAEEGSDQTTHEEEEEVGQHLDCRTSQSNQFQHEIRIADSSFEKNNAE